MKQRAPLTRVSIIAALLAASSLYGVSLASSANGATSSFPWTDPNAVGSLVFYNSAGQVITGGSLDPANGAPLAAYIEGTYNPQNADTKATLYAYTPVVNVAPGAWNGEVLGESTTYPVTAAGTPSTISSLTLPVETGNTGDESLGQYEEDYPNTDTSTTDGYSQLYVLRLYTSAPGVGKDVSYDDAVIEVTNTVVGNSHTVYQGTWSVVTTDPWTSGGTSTTTTTTTTPPSTSLTLGVSKSPATYGSAETLTATVSPTASGTVNFYHGTTLLGTSATANAVATLKTSLLPGGTDALHATFTPSGASSVAATSSTVSLVVKAASTKTSLKSSIGSAVKGSLVKLTAKVTPSTAQGHVYFYLGSKKIASVAVSKGSAATSTKTLPIGKDSFSAVFKPANAKDFATSTSATLKVTVKK